jgi:hypothetical protein
MSLDYLRVSLSKCFEAGQGCVAPLLLNRFARRRCCSIALRAAAAAQSLCAPPLLLNCLECCAPAVLTRGLQVRGALTRPFFGWSACARHGEMARGAKSANVY